MTEKLFITWNEFEEDMAGLTRQLMQGQFHAILAVSRGGLVPAGILAQELNIRTVDTIGVKSYDDDNKQGEVEVTMMPRLQDGKGVLVVDDLVDTGASFPYLEMLNRAVSIKDNELVAHIADKLCGVFAMDSQLEAINH